MKKSKRIISLCFAFMLLLGTLSIFNVAGAVDSTAAVRGECVKTDDYEIRILDSEEKTAQLYRVYASAVFQDGTLTLPAEVAGYKITTIDGNISAGMNSDSMKKVKKAIISDGIEIMSCRTWTQGEKNKRDPMFSSFENLEEAVIPANFEMGEYIFADCKELKKITFNGATVRIPCGAFENCTSLTEITVPKGTGKIGARAFAKCENLKTVNLNEGLESIGTLAFYLCEGLESITLPKGVSEIGGFSFNKCRNLETVKMYKGVEKIGEGAFMGCWSLKNINLPKGLKTIEECAFKNCKALTNIVIPKGVTEIAYDTFCNCQKLESVTLPSGLETIGSSAFAKCESLSSVTFPTSLKKIDSFAFECCTALGDKVKITKNIKTIAYGAFAGCTKLKGFKVAEKNKYFSQKDGVLLGKKQAKLYCYPAGKTGENYTVSSTVKSVSPYAFAYTKNLKKVTFSEKMTEVPFGAFYKSKIRTVICPKSIKEINDGAFLKCAKTFRNLTVLNKKCDFKDTSTYKFYKFTVHGYKNSTAEKLAEDADLKFVKL